jgi:hypothetical protein
MKNIPFMKAKKNGKPLFSIGKDKDIQTGEV